MKNCIFELVFPFDDVVDRHYYNETDYINCITIKTRDELLMAYSLIGKKLKESRCCDYCSYYVDRHCRRNPPVIKNNYSTFPETKSQYICGDFEEQQINDKSVVSLEEFKKYFTNRAKEIIKTEVSDE